MSAQQTELTPELLDKKLMGPLFVRCMVEVIPDKVTHSWSKMKTTIHLFDFWMDMDTNRYYPHLVYTEERRMNGETGNWKPLVGVDLTYLSSDQAIRLRELARLLQDWKYHKPLWLAPKQMVACIENERRELREFPATSREMLQHYARLETRLAYGIEMYKQTDQWIPCELFYHVSALLRDCNREWNRTVGGGILLD